MKSFSSSAINKSNKKFAPKAPQRRGAPAPSAPTRRPSAAQQAQAQAAAQALHHEKEATDSVAIPSASSAEPEQLEANESALIQAPDSGQATPISSKKATSIPIPQSKRKASVSRPGIQPSTAPTVSFTPTPEAPPSPRTAPIESELLPSIEHDAPQAAADESITEVSQSAQHFDVSDQGPSPRQSISETQDTSSAPVKDRSLKWAKKTSDITRTRGKGPVHTVPPISQPVPSSTGGTPGDSVGLSTPEASQVLGKGKKRKTSKASSTEAGEKKSKKVRRWRREATPEGAETVEILPNVIKMSELCKDLKTGRKSKRETELRKIELAEYEAKLKAQDEGTVGTPKKPNDAPVEKTDPLAEHKPQSGPVMRIVNGEIVLDAASLEVDRHADAARAAGDLEDVVENQLTRKVNQATYGKRSKAESWDEEMTELFYRGLRMFGTDFMVISKLFPGRSRRQIKLKFNNEERRDPQRIKDTLMGPRETIDIETYSEMTNQVFDDPKVIQRELDDEKKRIEEQHEQEKKLQEEMIRNPTGTGAEGDAASDDKANGIPSKSKARNSRKQSMKNAGGGTEEVLGSIDEIPLAA
ncbi:hypothetical protein N7462_010355 [Penicillium macrosclerotiorum]|uniref:uncharacterized protein n=1 Tax=Penicillium macrosclerotiorum TaxID=303699 RepID=UPI0025470F33|nr:uncharacterized protein N7462_010355 [Penicillium macrosclerotiorum]KAJ5669285.1 hypothetical protein N7462_010355 [Penicillium macrosclerotiorum]